LSPARTLTPADEVRLFLGLAVQPLVAAVLAFVTSPVLFEDVGRAVEGSSEVALGIALYVAIGVTIITALCVFPTVIWWVKRRPASLTTALLFGLAFGNLPAVLAVVVAGGARDVVRLHAFVSLIGLVGAAAFWTISVRGGGLSRTPTAA
jgi:hypothetical protein